MVTIPLRSAATLGIASVPATAVLAATAATPAVADSVRDCHLWASYPNVRISSVRDMSCRSAPRDMRRYQGSIRRRFRTPGGFACRRVAGGRLAAQWRCVHAGRAYRFDFSD